MPEHFYFCLQKDFQELILFTLLIFQNFLFNKKFHHQLNLIKRIKLFFTRLEEV